MNNSQQIRALKVCFSIISKKLKCPRGITFVGFKYGINGWKQKKYPGYEVLFLSVSFCSYFSTIFSTFT